MAIAANFPSIKPALNLDFANVGRLDPRVTFARASSGTYYDGVTTAKAEENLLTYSQAFNETAWTKTDVAATADTSTAPDGTSTADTLTASAGTGIFPRCFRATTTGTSGASYVVSIFAKAGTHNYIQLSNIAGTNWHANFDLTAGSGATGTSSGCTSSIASVGSDWYRCIVVYTPSTTDIAFRIGIADSSSAARFATWNPVGTETVLLWGAQLEQRSAVTAYTATTTQPITNYVPVLLTAQNNVSRFDHTPTTGAALGLEIEEQRTNLLTYSDDFADAAWTKTNSSITANTIVAPDGSLTGDKMIASSTNGTHSVAQGTVTSGTTYAFSVYAKAGEYSQLQLSGMGAEGQGFNTVYNLATQTVTSAPTGSSITSVGNGWYRCVLIITASSTAAPIIRIRDDSGNNNFAGNDFNGIFLWGAQLEAASTASSYIATTTTALTRSADAASMTGTAFSDFYNQAEGTLYVEAISGNATNDSGRLASINDNTSNNRVEVLYSTATQIQAILSANNVTQASFTETVTKQNANKVAFAYLTNNTNASINSSVETDDTTCDIPVVSQLNIGARQGGSNPINGTIKKIAYYPARLTDAQLQALTG